MTTPTLTCIPILRRVALFSCNSSAAALTFTLVTSSWNETIFVYTPHQLFEKCVCNPKIYRSEPHIYRTWKLLCRLLRGDPRRGSCSFEFLKMLLIGYATALANDEDGVTAVTPLSKCPIFVHLLPPYGHDHIAVLELCVDNPDPRVVELVAELFPSAIPKKLRDIHAAKHYKNHSMIEQAMIKDKLAATRILLSKASAVLAASDLTSTLRMEFVSLTAPHKIVCPHATRNKKNTIAILECLAAFLNNLPTTPRGFRLLSRFRVMHVTCFHVAAYNRNLEMLRYLLSTDTGFGSERARYTAATRGDDLQRFSPLMLLCADHNSEIQRMSKIERAVLNREAKKNWDGLNQDRLEMVRMLANLGLGEHRSARARDFAAKAAGDGAHRPEQLTDPAAHLSFHWVPLHMKHAHRGSHREFHFGDSPLHTVVRSVIRPSCSEREMRETLIPIIRILCRSCFQYCGSLCHLPDSGAAAAAAAAASYATYATATPSQPSSRDHYHKMWNPANLTNSYGLTPLHLLVAAIFGQNATTATSDQGISQRAEIALGVLLQECRNAACASASSFLPAVDLTIVPKRPHQLTVFAQVATLCSKKEVDDGSGTAHRVIKMLLPFVKDNEVASILDRRGMSGLASLFV